MYAFVLYASVWLRWNKKKTLEKNVKDTVLKHKESKKVREGHIINLKHFQQVMSSDKTHYYNCNDEKNQNHNTILVDDDDSDSDDDDFE